MPAAAGYEDAESLMAAVMGPLPENVQKALLKGRKSVIGPFLNGDLAVYITSQNALWQLRKQELLGKTLPSFAAYPVAGFASRSECAVLFSNPDKARQQAAQAFVSLLLGRQAQTALADIYALPAVQGTACARADLAPLWQSAEKTVTVFSGKGASVFMDRVAEGAAIEVLKGIVVENCLTP
jgi:hypothetical protein